MPDCLQEIVAKIENAYQQKQALEITAGKTKQFYGRTINAEVLNVSGHKGLIEYEPSELYITARSGTPVTEIERELEKENQILLHLTINIGSVGTVLSQCARPF